MKQDTTARTGATVKVRIVTRQHVEEFIKPIDEYLEFFLEQMHDDNVFHIRSLYQFDTMTFDEAINILSNENFGYEAYTDEDFVEQAQQYALDTVVDMVAPLIPNCDVLSLAESLSDYEFTGSESPESLALSWNTVNPE